MSHATRVPLLFAISFAAVLGAAAGCSGHSKSGTTTPTPTPTPGQGSLAVTITATGVTPSVSVSGPGGYAMTLSSSATLTGLVAGSYAVTASNETMAGAIVDQVLEGVVTGSPATVSAGATASVGVDYQKIPGTGALWTGRLNDVIAIDAADLAASGTPTPVLTVGYDMTGPQDYGLAFAPDGAAWVGQQSGNALLGFAHDAVAAGASAATFTITSTDLAVPEDPQFDGAGTLWVSSLTANKVLGFAASQLGASGAVTPQVVLGTTAFDQPLGRAFDASGNLWVANFNGGSIVEIAAGDLAVSGDPTPVVTLTGIASPWYLAFDAAGNLWVSSGNTVNEIAANDLTASAAVTPAVVLTANGGSLSAVRGLAFDNAGNLWAASSGANTIVRFTPAQLAASGNPVPDATISLSDSPQGLAFHPRTH